MKRSRKWLLVGITLGVVLFVVPFFLPDRPPFRFLNRARLKEMTVWWDGDKPTWTRYRLAADYEAVLAEGRAELLSLGYREAVYTGKGEPYSIFELGNQSVVGFSRQVESSGTYIDVAAPHSIFDHLRDFKFQFLSGGR